MKKQVIKINKKVYDNRGNEFAGCIIPLDYRIVQNQEVNHELQRKMQQGVIFENLKEVMNIRMFKLTVVVRAFANEKELATPHMAFVPFKAYGNPQSSVNIVHIEIPDAEFTEATLAEATEKAFATYFVSADENGVETFNGVELVEL